jgi:acyl dehydratase
MRPEMLSIQNLEFNERYNLGSHVITAEEIMRFGCEYDPQIYHTNPSLAKKTAFAGLIASGWHLTSIWMRLYVEALIIDVDSAGSPGVDELRWFTPARPNEKLTAYITLTKKSPSLSQGKFEIYHQKAELVNHLDSLVAQFIIYGLFPKKQT